VEQESRLNGLLKKHLTVGCNVEERRFSAA
jgi:hypothetical protein